ncbi:hypothetical protein RAS_01800 [Rickettsia asiatica]|uniref:Uncharacterized protein n=1 Tax=Rickettsia asiatica TaxID=238800 RepID=A0A510GIC5_9RICK|nr:hypothetical protein RAS_01800 [Rickettsia asiatica]
MQSSRSCNNAILNEENTDSQIKNIVPYDYKKKREELNKLVKNHIAKQQQNLTQKNKSMSV